MSPCNWALHGKCGSTRQWFQGWDLYLPRLEHVRQVHDLRKIRIHTELEGFGVPQLSIQPQLSVNSSFKSEGSALFENS